MTLNDIVKSIADTVKESVQNAFKQLSERFDVKFSALSKDFSHEIERIENIINKLPAPEKGDKGDSVTIEDVEPLLKQMVEQLVLPKGDSVTVEDLEPLLKKMVEQLHIPVPSIQHLEKAVQDAIAQIPDVKNGEDGKSPSADEVAAQMGGQFSKWALEFERRAIDQLERTIDRFPKPKDGQDAAQIESFDLSLAEDGRTVTASLKCGERVVQKSVKIPAFVDQGLYKSDHEYEKGDCVTFGGSLWICQKDLPAGRPGETSDWRLAVKRGRDGSARVAVKREDKPVKIGEQ